MHFVSCLHFGHDREFLWKPRGFKNVTEHDETLIQRWNERVGKDDIVFSIGDTIFGQNADVRLKEIFRRLTFWKLFVSPGNHFSGWHQLYKEALKSWAESKGLTYEEVRGYHIYPLEYLVDGDPSKRVLFMPNQFSIYAGRQAICLNHFPEYPHNGAGKGVWGVFGHCHGNNPDTNPNTAKRKTLDVCVESFGGPVDFQTVERWMNSKEADDVAHHKKDTAYAI